MSMHVYPINDMQEHDTESNGDCACDPDVEWIDQETGLPYGDGPLVVHNAYDRRD